MDLGPGLQYWSRKGCDWRLELEFTVRNIWSRNRHWTRTEVADAVSLPEADLSEALSYIVEFYFEDLTFESIVAFGLARLKAARSASGRLVGFPHDDIAEFSHYAREESIT